MNALPLGFVSYLGAANIALSLSRVDAPDCELVEVNDRFCSLTGYSRDEVLGRNCRFLQGELRDQPGNAPLRDFLADTTQRRVRTHLINVRADGVPFVNMLTISRLTGPGGTPRYFLASQFDVTAAAPADLLDYSDALRAQLAAHARGYAERDIILGSLHSLSEAATAIAQARLLMEEADRAGLLGAIPVR